jgi:glycosyltransferase involved in cell wall biosynthesis
VALLPSYAESYGYSILEAQACGCPVITTDIGAMPEINNNCCGWVINLPKRDYGGKSLGRSRYNTADGRREISTVIKSQLEKIILSILDNPQSLEDRRDPALNRIRKEHDPRTHAAELKRIYLEALAET